MVTPDPSPLDIKHACPECGKKNGISVDTIKSTTGQILSLVVNWNENISRATDWGGGYQCSDCNIVFWPDLPDVGVVHLQTLF